MAADESGSFQGFQELLKKIAGTSGLLDKTAAVKDFIEDFKGDMFILFKFLLAKEDHRVFNMRDKQVVKLLSTVFGATQKEMKEDLSVSGGMGETAAKFFERSGVAQKRSTLTLKEVDGFLDSFTSLTKEAEQTALWRRIIARCTVDDVRYFCYLIDHDLRAGIGTANVLPALHPDAYEAFKKCWNLKQVVDRALGRSNSSVEETAKGEAGGNAGTAMKSGFSIMTPVRPMLARASNSVKDAMKRCPGGMFSEIKYDGERIQIHKDGDTFKFFSRSLKPVMEWKIAPIKDIVKKATTANQIVLDGEMLLVDTVTGKPLPFGSYNVHKQKQFNAASPCAFIFDCLYINGRTLMDTPLVERRKILQENVTEIKNSLHLSEYQEVHHEEDLTMMMNRVIVDGLEGLVMKALESVYTPAARHWLKIKKDYLEGMADSADLVVLGGYFGTGAKAGMVSGFLMGVFDSASKQWKTVVKVANGFTEALLAKLQTELVPQMTLIRGVYESVPRWLDVHRSHTPDYVAIDPKKMPVWEIAGAEFTPSPHHTADGISIRFPRMIKARDDKDWSSATSLAELIALKAASAAGGENRKRKLPVGDEDEDDDDEEKKRPAKKRKLSPAPKAAAASKPASPAPAPAPAKAAKKGPMKQTQLAFSSPTRKTGGADGGPVTIVPGRVNDVDGDVSQPFSPHPHAYKIIILPLDDSGRWSTRGVFGAISQLSDQPRKEYELSCEKRSNCSPGDVQLIPVLESPGGGDTYVCNLIYRRAGDGAASDVAHFEAGLAKVVSLAAEMNASVHVARDGGRNLDAAAVRAALERTCAARDVTCLVYTFNPAAARAVVATAAATTTTTTTPAKAPAKKVKAEIAAPDGDDTEEETMEIARDHLPLQPLALPAALAGMASKTSATLKGVRVVFDGLEAARVRDLSAKVRALGGEVHDRWNAATSTHLVCLAASEVSRHADDLGGFVVTPEFVEDCVREGKRVEEHSYPIAPPVADTPFELLDIFTDLTMYVHGAVGERDKLTRCIIAYDGNMEDAWEGAKLTHVITEGEWSDELEAMLRANMRLRVVRPAWIWQSIRLKRLAPERPYFVRRSALV